MDLIGNQTMVTLLVFLAAATLAFGVMALVRVQGSVKRRAAGIGKLGDETGNSRSLRHSSLKAAQRVLEYTTKHYSSDDKSQEMKVLRRRMMQAGIYDPRAAAYFFLGRIVLSVGLAAGLFCFAPTDSGSMAMWLYIGSAGIGLGAVLIALMFKPAVRLPKPTTVPAE